MRPQIEGTIAKVLGSGNLTPGQRLSITVDKDIGTLHIVTSKSEAILGIFSSQYGRRPAFEMLSQVSTYVQNNVTQTQIAQASKQGEINRQCISFFKEMCGKYENAVGDKITSVGMKIDEVKAVMEQNINRVLQNAEDLEVVENKSEILRQDAQQFQRKSESIKRALWWRNFKLKCIIFLLVSVVLLYILIPIISKS